MPSITLMTLPLYSLAIHRHVRLQKKANKKRLNIEFMNLKLTDLNLFNTSNPKCICLTINNITQPNIDILINSIHCKRKI